MERKVCYNCLRCVDVCPEKLLPNFLYHFCCANQLDEARNYRLSDCTLCGKCNTVCVAGFCFTKKFVETGKELLSHLDSELLSEALATDDTAQNYQITFIQSLMWFVLVVLANIYLLAISVYGWRVFFLLVVCVVTGFCCDVLVTKLSGAQKPVYNSIFWFLFPLALPVGTPYWMAAIGLAFSLLIAIYMFGGPRKNLFNPVAIGVVFLQLSYSTIFMQSFYKPFFPPMLGFKAYTSNLPVTDYPLIVLRSIDALQLQDLLFGQQPGAIADSFPVLVFIVGMIFLYLKLLDWRFVTASFLGLAIFSTLGHFLAKDKVLPFYLQLLVGSFLPYVMLYSLDTNSLAHTPIGRWAFGFIFAFFTVLIRGFSASYEGVFFAAILAGVFCPIFDKLQNYISQR